MSFSLRTCPCLALILAGLMGCTSKPVEDATAVHHERARQLLAAERYIEALAEYDDAATKNPQDDEALYEAALLHIKLGGAEHLDAAQRALVRVVKLNPSRPDAHVQLARFLLLSGQPAKARLHADAVLALQPLHAEAHLIKGQSWLRDGNHGDSLIELGKAIKSDPTRPEGYLEVAKLRAVQHQYSQAEEILRAGMAQAPRSVGLRMALGDLLAVSGKTTEAVGVYREGLEVEPQSGPLYLKLAAISFKQKRMVEAEALYRKWIDVQPNDAMAHVALAQLYHSTGRGKDALAELQAAQRLDPGSSVVREALVTFYLETGWIEEAAHHIDAWLDEQPTDVSAHVLQARLRLDQRRTDEALSLLREAVRHAPRAATVQQYLGIALAKAGNIPDALAALREAKTLAPDSSDIHTNLAQVYLADGALHVAIKEAEEAIRLNPQALAALKVLGDAYLQNGNGARALPYYEQVASMTPDDPRIHYRLGMALRVRGRDEKALAHFEEALEGRSPDLDALDQLVSLLVVQGKAQHARDRVESLLATMPDEPRLHNLMGQLLAQARRFAEAESAYKTALKIDSGLLATYIHLGVLYVQWGKVADAIRQFEAVSEKQPRNPAALMVAGVLYEQRRDIDRAEAKYLAALAIEPNFGPAANNLAWLLLEHRRNPNRALPYAETARASLPRDPHVADTLGWVHYHIEGYEKAAALLKEALDRMPDSPVVLYHYGMAQYRNGRGTEAAQALKRFLAVSPSDSHADQAKSVLANLSDKHAKRDNSLGSRFSRHALDPRIPLV